ncbi:MAG: hypothetical protein N2376_09715 [Clostridia bacterium]|nr:hypothetical protein [Clostridia bacterium]
MTMNSLKEYKEWYFERFGRKPSEKLMESFCMSNGMPWPPPANNQCEEMRNETMTPPIIEQEQKQEQVEPTTSNLTRVLYEMLLGLQWCSNSHGVLVVDGCTMDINYHHCPVCGNVREHGHSENCELSMTLKRYEAEGRNENNGRRV